MVGTAQLVYGLALADATCEYDHDVIAADHDLIVVPLTPAQQAAGYWILATDSYADTLEALAAGSDAPWADNRAALARAAAIQDDEQYGPRPFGMPREVTHFSAIEGSLAVTSDVG